MTDDTSAGGLSGRILNLIERIGNLLPDPTALFIGGAVVVVLLSALGSSWGWTVEKPVSHPVTEEVVDSVTGKPVTIRTYSLVGRVQKLDMEKVTDESGVTVTRPRETVVKTARVNPETGGLLVEPTTEKVVVKSLLSRDGIYWAFSTMVHNFTDFHPLGVVLVAMLGIGVAEKTGCIGAFLKALMLITPGRLLTPAMVFIGVMSSMAADAGYVILPPVAAALYKAVGRSPLVGLAAVFSGVSAGFSANLFLTSLDPLLQGLSQESAQILDPTYTVNPACNLYFMIASTFILTALGWAVTAWIVEPRFARKPPEEGGPSAATAEDHEVRRMSPGEWRGIQTAAISTIIAAAIAVALVVVPGAPLHAPEGEPARWVDAIVPLLAILFLVPGIAYGITESTITANTNTRTLDAGIARMMAQTMADMGPYIVLAFFAAQFIAYFNYTNLGLMLAITGGEALASASLPPWALLALFIMVVMLGNLFIGSASAKYAFFAPVFVPMFMADGVNISPELTQLSYRVGDSVTNIISPLNPYVIIILVFMKKYVPKAGIGTLVSLMLPYALVFWVIWTLMLIAWVLIGLPIGPDAPLSYPPPVPGG
ncbi:MAG: AbgT family transporter [Phycisphaerales bacterium]|nr:AbgT family transporter [Phycisphaerales bacterium]